MTYYDIPKVLEIINHYHAYKENIDEYKYIYSSVGVAQGGIESTLPKAQGQTSDTVANEAINAIEGNKAYANIVTDMKYIENRWHRVTDERDAMVLNYRLEGYSAIEIAQLLRCTDRTVRTRLYNIAKVISGI